MAKRKERFGQAIRMQCVQALHHGAEADKNAALLAAADFITERLTEAAIEGCHHCGEGDKGSPCWWCGLKN